MGAKWESETRRRLWDDELGKIATIWCFEDRMEPELTLWRARISSDQGAVDGLVGRFEHFKTEGEAREWVAVMLDKLRKRALGRGVTP